MDEINEILTRGVANIIPSKEILEKEIRSGKKLNIYMGIDPTATRIHLGHAVTLKKLQSFANLGHNVTFLVGDFTAKIGDTSDKLSERPILTDVEIQTNLASYKEQASKILDFSKITIKFNSEWLSELKFGDVLQIIKNFSLNDFISRELIKKRLNNGQSVGLLETMYPLMQGYDSYVLKTDIQLGGTDQTFNMQAGRSLIQNLDNRESFVITNTFLTGTDGRKMSKSWSNAIWLTDNYNDMYGKVMSIKDDLIIEYFTLATDVPMQEIDSLTQQLKNNENPMNIKKQLAFEITKMYHGDENAKLAQEGFESVVQHKEIPQDLPSVNFPNGETLISTVVNNKLVDSSSEWKRLINQGAASINDKKIDNPFLKNDDLPDNGILKIGKRNYVRIKK